MVVVVVFVGFAGLFAGVVFVVVCGVLLVDTFVGPLAPWVVVGLFDAAGFPFAPAANADAAVRYASAARPATIFESRMSCTSVQRRGKGNAPDKRSRAGEIALFRAVFAQER
jgi:hypothetical protein